jgi:hypothetical protein
MPRQGSTGQRAVLATACAAAVCGAAWAQPRIVAAGAERTAQETTAPGRATAAIVRAAEHPGAALTVVPGPALGMQGIVPGAQASTTFTIRNDGPGAAIAPALSLGSLREQAGRGGGLLSQRLLLTIRRASGAVVFRGTVAALGRVVLGTIAPRREERFTLAVAFPDGGTPPGPLSGDNAFQGATMDVALDVQAR